MKFPQILTCQKQVSKMQLFALLSNTRFLVMDSSSFRALFHWRGTKGKEEGKIKNDIFEDSWKLDLVQGTAVTG